MLCSRLLLPLSAVAFANCGGTVPLEARPCPCSAGWRCCPTAQICVEESMACPAPPLAYCKPGWQPTDTWCVLDADVKDSDVCHFADSPTVQENLDGEIDACAKTHDPEGLYRAFDCTVSFGGTLVEGMVVDHGAQLVLPGRDRCRLRATLLMTEPPH